MSRNFIILTLIAGSFFGCNSEPAPVIVDAELISYDLGNGVELMGSVRASYINEVTTISISLINQMQGTIRAVHLYDGNCEDPGEIWNMNTDEKFCDILSLNKRWSKPYIGNVGNIVIESDGTGEFQMSTDLWSIGTGNVNDIVNKTIVIHAGPENFIEECDPNHVPDHFHPNSKIACGALN